MDPHQFPGSQSTHDQVVDMLQVCEGDWARSGPYARPWGGPNLCWILGFLHVTADPPVRAFCTPPPTVCLTRPQCPPRAVRVVEQGSGMLNIAEEVGIFQNGCIPTLKQGA